MNSMHFRSSIKANLAGVFLALTYFVLLLGTQDIGFPRDEGFYFSAGEQYSRWIDDLFADPVHAFSRENVETRFGNNPEHPALWKFLFGLSWRLFGAFSEDKGARYWYEGGSPPKPIFGIMKESTAMRLPAMLVASFLVYLIFRFGFVFFNFRVGVASALAWMFMPHVFWHSHLACFDVPVTAMWFWTTYCFLRSMNGGGVRWAIYTGVVFGLALSTKHNSFFLPPVLVLFYLLTHYKEFSIKRSSDGGVRGISIPPIPWAFVAMLIISPVIYYLLWPKLWFDPIGHLKWYIQRHTAHEYYWAYYFGTLYTEPPFPIEFPFVMSLITIPGPTIVLAFLGGAVMLLRRFARTSSMNESKVRGLGLFVFLNFLVPFAVIAHPKVPIFGGTKHWMHGVPYVALFAGVGVDYVLQGLAQVKVERAWRACAWALASLVMLLAPAFDTLHGYTNGSTYYNAFVNGRRAMGEFGLQREFWGNSAFSALEYINKNAPQGARVDFHDTAWDSVKMYRRVGLLREDIVPIWDYNNADYFLFHWHKEFLDLEGEVRGAFLSQVPVFVVSQDGVPLLSAYKRGGQKAEKGTRGIGVR